MDGSNLSDAELAKLYETTERSAEFYADGSRFFLLGAVVCLVILIGTLIAGEDFNWIVGGVLIGSSVIAGLFYYIGRKYFKEMNVIENLQKARLTPAIILDVSDNQ